jgi:hypothetical protein
MQGQDRQTEGAAGSSPGDGSQWLTVPAGFVERLRQGAFVAIGAAAHRIDGWCSRVSVVCTRSGFAVLWKTYGRCAGCWT